MIDKRLLLYVATPYLQYQQGLDQAFIDACQVTAKLIAAGFSAYSPIAHTHPVAHHGELDKLDHALWVKFNSIMLQKSDALLVVQMPGWEESKGIMIESLAFYALNRPVYRMPWPEFDLSEFESWRVDPASNTL